MSDAAWSGLTPPTNPRTWGFQAGYDPRRNLNGQKNTKELIELARSYTIDAINRIAFWMNSDIPNVSLRAAEILLERAYGKAPMTIQTDGEGFSGLKIEVVFVDPNGNKQAPPMIEAQANPAVLPTTW